MGSIDAELARLGGEFDQHSIMRLQSMRDVVAALGQARGDVALLQQLHREFHAFSGAGTTYGRPRVSQLGDDGEELTSRRLRSRTAVSDEDMATFARLIDELTATFAERRA